MSRQVKGARRLASRGFQRIHLEPDASQKVHFELKRRDPGMVKEDGNPIIAQRDCMISIGGGQPDTGAPDVSADFHIDGQYDWPNKIRWPAGGLWPGRQGFFNEIETVVWFQAARV